MRLIDTRTLDLCEFTGDKIPEQYAILSHRWEDEEVTFQDWQDLGVAKKKKGFVKLDMACKQAQKHGLDYLWADTNCIDKTSSAELSEAINSMFSWYQRSTICYAYLSDVEISGSFDITNEHQSRHFCGSKWFTRGWTLQELLAPVSLTFYSRDWSEIASRSTMADLICESTRIDTVYLQGDGLFRRASTAQKMSWVSRRVTTRAEDIAYCMLGIFDVNMPSLYGEGPRSFTRLQEEIIRTSNDQTIFCWTWIDSIIPPGWESMFAPCPEAFKQSEGFITADSKIFDKITFKMTNAGLSITLPVVKAWSYYLGILNASIINQAAGEAERLVCIPI